MNFNIDHSTFLPLAEAALLQQRLFLHFKNLTPNVQAPSSVYPKVQAIGPQATSASLKIASEQTENKSNLPTIPPPST